MHMHKNLGLQLDGDRKSLKQEGYHKHMLDLHGYVMGPRSGHKI